MAFQIEVAAITILLSVSLLTLLLTFFLSLFHFQCALYVLGFKNKFMTNSNPVSHLFSNWIFSHSLMIYIYMKNYGFFLNIDVMTWEKWFKTVIIVTSIGMNVWNEYHGFCFQIRTKSYTLNFMIGFQEFRINNQ